MPEYVYGIVLVVVFVVVLVWFSNKKRNEVWKGKLVKKGWNAGDMDRSSSYFLVFETEEGKRKSVNTYDQRYYDLWSEGDMAEKVKGEFYPKKV